MDEELMQLLAAIRRRSAAEAAAFEELVSVLHNDDVRRQETWRRLRAIADGLFGDASQPPPVPAYSRHDPHQVN